MNESPESHERMLDRVLAYEHLEPDERRLADEHLAGCPRCRALLEGLRERARRARPPALPSDARGAAPRPTWWRWVPAAATAAVFAVLAMWPRPAARRGDRESPPASVGALEVVRGPARHDGAAEWSTGSAFTLRVTLDRPGQPVVYHVDPAGGIERLYPDSASAPLRAWPAGTYELPPDSSGIAWTLAGEPGPETFLALAVPPHADLAALGDSLAAVAPAGSRAAREAAWLATLLRLAGPVRVVQIEHVR